MTDRTIIHRLDVGNARLVVLWVRHGQSEGNLVFEETGKVAHDSHQHDPPLTSTGRAQAANVAWALWNRIEANGWTGRHIRLRTSPLRRTQQTAEPFLRLLDEKRANYIFDVDPQLFEFFLRSDLHPDEDFTDASVSQFQERVRKWTDRLTNEAPSEPEIVVVFGHSLFISAAIQYIVSGMLALDGIHRMPFHLSNCSISESALLPGAGSPQWIVTRVNDVSHHSRAQRTGCHVRL